MLISGGELVLSDTTPSFARTNYYPNTGLDLTSLHASYGVIYRNQLWVYVVVSKRARATARLPLKVYERAEVGRNPAGDSPYGKLMARPNPKHDTFFFMAWTSSTLDVYGEAIWLKVRGRDGRPAQLWPVHPSLIQVRVLPNEATGEPETWYAYLGGLAATTPVLLIPERDVVHFKAYNPDTTVRGMSPLEPLRQTLVNEDAARRATSSFWANGARPGVALTHPQQISEPAARRLKQQWDALAGGVDRTGSTVVLEEGMHAEKLTLSAEEAQYIETRKLNREEVCACYDMPPPAVHILDRATFSNITEQNRMLYRDTMATHLGLLESTMEHQLAPDFAGDFYAEFLMDEVLRGDFEARIEAEAKGVQFGLLMPSEAREMENRRDAGPDSHRLYINSTMVPLDGVSVNSVGALVRAGFDPEASVAALGLPPIKHTGLVPVTVQGEDVAVALQAGQVPKGLSLAQVRTLLSRIGRAESFAGIKSSELTAGLNGEAALVAEALRSSSSIEQLKSRIKSLSLEGGMG